MFSYKPHWDSFYVQDDNYYHRDVPSDDPHPSLTGHHKTELCIIGGGFTGLSCAYHARQLGKEVILLERHALGYGASGRCGGQILPGFAADMMTIERCVGLDDARHLWNLSLEGVDIIERIIKNHAIDCAYKPGNLVLARSKKDTKTLAQLQEYHSDTLGYDMTMIGREDLAADLRSTHYDGALYSPAGSHFHPLQYLCGLAGVLRDQGVQIFCRSAAEAIIQKDGKFLISTPGGMITADSIALCGDAYQGRLVPSLRRKYVLIRCAMIATEPLSEDQAVFLSDRCAFEHANALHFFRKTADNRLLFGGGDVIQPLKTTLNTQKMIVETLSRQLPDIFPSLKGIGIDYGWGGYIGMTSSCMPNVGQLMDGAFYASGYSGHGVNSAHICGKLLAEAAAGQSDRYRLFDRFKNISFPGRGYWDHWLARIGIKLHEHNLLY